MVIKTSAHYQREYRKRLREQGLVKKEIWILPEQRQNARDMEKQLRKPLSSPVGSLSDTDGSKRTKWRTGALYGELNTTGLVSGGKASIKIIDGAEPTMMITMHEYGDLPVFMTVSGDLIVAESILWPASYVKDQPAFNETVLRTQHYYPLSTICLGKRADEDYYLMEGSLSSLSNINDIILEIEAFADNVIRVTEAYVGILQSVPKVSMDVLSEIVTTNKDGMTEAGDAIIDNQIDNQAIHILDQEIREVQEALNQSKDSLVSIIAGQNLSVEKTTTIQESIDENEGYVIKALDKADQSLARDVATKIAALETNLATEKNAGVHFSNSADKMRHVIAKATNEVQHMKFQAHTVKATDTVQKAEAAVSKRHSGTGNKLRTAIESLDRIKEKQILTGALMSTPQTNAEFDLDNVDDELSLHRRLVEAGIKNSNTTDDVLRRIKQKRT